MSIVSNLENLRIAGRAARQRSEAQTRRDKVRKAREEEVSRHQPSSSSSSHDCGCGPVPPQARYTTSCETSVGLPLIVDGAELVDDGAIERGKIRVPSSEQYALTSDRLGPNLTVLDNGELVVGSSSYSYASPSYNLDQSGLPGLYRITLTAPNADAAKAFRSRVDLLFKQYTQIPEPAGTGGGREGISSFEIQASADDTIIDIWTLPQVELPGSRGQVIEPAMLGAFQIGGTVFNLAGNNDFLPAAWNAAIALGSDGAEGTDDVIVNSGSTGTGVVSWTSGTKNGVSFPTMSTLLPDYRVDVRAYGPMSRQYHALTRKLLAAAGG